MDAYVSFRNSDGTRAEPICIKEQLGGGNFTLSGRYLMVGGLRWVDIKVIENLRPKEVE